ncbi:hypothetical protein D3C78_985420 [compost metagenome]
MLQVAFLTAMVIEHPGFKGDFPLDVNVETHVGVTILDFIHLNAGDFHFFLNAWRQLFIGDNHLAQAAVILDESTVVAVNRIHTSLCVLYANTYIIMFRINQYRQIV